MPSVDRVGRYFPLTVARARGAAETRLPAAWLRALEGVAVAALQADWSAERFDMELRAVDASIDTDDEAEAAGLWPSRGATTWWSERDGDVSSPVMATGLPDAAAFVRLFGGRG